MCYKALTVIDYLIANGSETIVREIQRRIGRDLQPLKTFEHRDPEKGRDEGINIRQKVTNMIALLEDPERVREVREKARMNRGKYSGMSNADLKASRNRNSANDTYNNRATYNNNDSATRVATPTTTSVIASPSATTPAPKSKNDGAHSGTSAMSNVLNAFEDDKDDDEDDDDGDNDEFMTGGGNQRSKGPPTFVPKVVIRDTPIQRPPNSAGFSATLKPPPRGGNAFVNANNTNLFFESRPAGNTQKPTTASPTISLDELLGGRKWRRRRRRRSNQHQSVLVYGNSIPKRRRFVWFRSKRIETYAATTNNARTTNSGTSCRDRRSVLWNGDDAYGTDSTTGCDAEAATRGSVFRFRGVDAFENQLF